MHKLFRKTAFLKRLFVIFTVITLAVTLLPTQAVFADAASDYDAGLLKRVKAYLGYNAFKTCMQNSDGNTNSERSKIIIGDWDFSNGVTAGDGIAVKPADVTCDADDSSGGGLGARRAMDAMEINNDARRLKLYCTLANQGKVYDDCENASGGMDKNFEDINAGSYLVKAVEAASPIKPFPFSLNDAEKYVLNREVLKTICSAKATNDTINTEKTMIANVVGDYDSAAGKYAIKSQYFKLGGDKTDSSLVSGRAIKDALEGTSKCGDLGVSNSKTKTYAEKYAEGLVKSVTATGGNPADVPPADTGTGGGTGDADAPPTCQGGALGWILCPAIEGMRGATETAGTLLDSLLNTPPLTVGDADAKDAILTAWGNIRNIANILFVVAFLVIIFSQATSIGISNYGVKKMLPRMVAAAILVNLSYYVCAIMIDVSNILGKGVGELIATGAGANIGSAVSSADGAGLGALFSNNGDNFAGIALATIGAALLVAAFLLPILLTILATLIVLAIRTALIFLLTIVAPLAFVAWLLPNTEQWLKKWWSLFFSMLMLYPLVMAVFAGATVVANILVTRSNAGSEGDIALKVAALIIQALPLFAMPFLFKVAGGVLGKIQAVTQGVTNKAGKASGGFVKKRYENSGFGQAAAMRKKTKETVRQRRGLTGRGVRGALFNARQSIGAVTPRQGEVNQLMQEQVSSARRGLDNERVKNADEMLTPFAALSLAGSTDPKHDYNNLNASDKAAVDYMRSNGLDKGELGARSVGTYLNKTGFMTPDLNKKLVDMAGPAGTKEGNLARSTVNDQLNAAAMASGQYHLAYNKVDKNGNFQLMGQKSGASDVDRLKDIIAAKGLSSLSKEAYARGAGDFNEGGKYDAAFQDLYNNPATNESFMKSTLAISEEKKLQGLADALGMTRQNFELQRQAAAKKYS